MTPSSSGALSSTPSSTELLRTPPPVSHPPPLLTLNPKAHPSPFNLPSPSTYVYVQGFAQRASPGPFPHDVTPLQSPAPAADRDDTLARRRQRQSGLSVILGMRQPGGGEEAEDEEERAGGERCRTPSGQTIDSYYTSPSPLR